MVAPLKVGLAGLGTVGASVVRLIDAAARRARRALRPADRGRRGQRALARARTAASICKKLRWVDDPVALARDPEHRRLRRADRRRGRSGARPRSRRRSSAGKPVVTANKALLAAHGVALAAARREATASRSISRRRSAAASRSSRRCARGSPATRIARIYGILNGTCNYILTRMEQEKLSFADCLKEAQRLGYAEADPTFDIEGHDTAQKLAILASLAFGTEVDPSAVYVEGISSITPADLEAADELGYRIKLLGVAVRTEQGIEQRVHPTMVPKDSAIAQVDGRHQRGGDRGRRDRADHAGRPGRRRHGDRLGGGRRHRRHRPRRARARRSAGRRRSSTVSRQGADAAPRGRLLHPPAGASTSPAPPRPSPSAWRSRTSRWNRSCSAAATRRPHGGDDPRRADEPVPVILITYATTEDAVRKALAAVKARQGDLGRSRK